MKHFVNPNVPFRDARREIIESIVWTHAHPRADLPREETYINRARVRSPERDSHARPFARHLSIKRSSAFASARRGERKYHAGSITYTLDEAGSSRFGDSGNLRAEFSPYRLRPRHRSDTIDRRYRSCDTRGVPHSARLICLLAYAA